MRKIVLLSVLSIICYSLKMKSHEAENVPVIVGGYSSFDVNNLTDSQKDIDSYLKSTFPQLNSLRLTDVQTQVVSGMNYKYTYTDDSNNKSYQYIVWDQPWMKNRQITQVKTVQHSVN